MTSSAVSALALSAALAIAAGPYVPPGAGEPVPASGAPDVKYTVELIDLGFGRPNLIPIGAPAQLACDATDEQLPTEAQTALANYEEALAAIQRKADAEKQQQRDQTIAALKELQDKFTRDAKLDEAVAIRDRIRRLKRADLPIYRDPGSLYQFQSQIGKSFLFEVVGSLDGHIWGTEVYTGDSALAKAAVQMGLVKPGQKAIVKVTFIPSPAEHKGSTQNDVTSSSYGSYSFSYTVEPFREQQ